MSTEKMRKEFEVEWGYTNEEQGLKFIPSLNVYGCDLYDNAGIASNKSSAWYYWQASRAAIEVELPSRLTQDGRSICIDKDGEFLEYCDVVGAIKALGLKVKP